MLRRGDEVIIPDGDTQVLVGDEAVIASLAS